MPWQMVHDVKLARAAGVTLFSFSPNWPIQSRRAHARVRTALQHEGIDALESTKDTKGKSHGPAAAIKERCPVIRLKTKQTDITGC